MIRWPSRMRTYIKVGIKFSGSATQGCRPVGEGRFSLLDSRVRPSPSESRILIIVISHPLHRIWLIALLISIALMLASCATAPPANPPRPPPNVSLGPVLELLQAKTTSGRACTLIDNHNDAHVFIVAVDSKEVYHIVVAPDGTVQRETVESNTSPSNISAAFASDGKLHLLLDEKHLVREGVSWIVSSNTPWEDAGIKIHAARLTQVDKGLVWTFLVDGKEAGGRGRWSWFGFGGYGAGIVFPWRVSSEKLMIVPQTAVVEPVWYVLDPQDNYDTANSMVAADSNGIVHIVYEAYRSGLFDSSQPRYAEIELMPAGPGVERRLPDSTLKGKRLFPVSGRPIRILGIERPFYFRPAAMAVDPSSGTILVLRGDRASFVLTNGKWSLPMRLPSSPYVVLAPAGGDAFHVVTVGKSAELLYLRYSQGVLSGPVALGEKGSNFFLITSNGNNRAFVLSSKKSRIVGLWVVVTPGVSHSRPSLIIDSSADYHGEEKTIPEDLLDFANGTAELVQPGLISGYGAAIAAGTAGNLTKYMHDSEQWETLARETLKNKYGDNLGWYYLGRAAEGMGLCDAAIRYYGISEERSKSWLTSCLSKACAGIKLPDALKDRLLAIEAMHAAGQCSADQDKSTQVEL